MVRARVTSTAILVCATCAWAQQPSAPSDKPTIEAVDVVQRAPELINEPKDISDAQRTTLNTFVKTFQALTAGHCTRRSFALKGVETFKPLSNTEARDRILNAKDPTGNPSDERFVGDIANYRLVQQHKAVIKDLFNNAKMFVSTGAGPVQYFGPSDIRFASLKGKTMMIQSRGTELFFDSSDTEAKTRARDAVDLLILPSIKEFQEAMKADGIDWFAIHVTYGSRDVKKQKAADEVSESVCAAWKKDEGQAYLAGTLTANQFLRTCVIVHSDRHIISVTPLIIEPEDPKTSK